jgi:hypothetical protein
MNTCRLVAYVIAGVLCQAVSGLTQEAILPQGDPRLQESDEERAEIRDRRLKQQGQGKEYRIEGERQGGSSAATEGDPHGLSRQETGIADPSVNPGQASGMRVVRGEVKQATLKTIVIEDRNGKEATMSIDAATAGDRDIRPGDVITGTITAQGRAVAIHKEQGAEHIEGGGHGDISPRGTR